MQNNTSESLYNALVKAIVFATIMVVLLWLLLQASGVILMLLFALVLALVINSPVASLEKKGIKRGWASAIVFAIILLVIILLAWLIVPIISKQVTLFINNLPDYANNLSRNVTVWFKDYPEISKDIQQKGITLSEWIPSVPQTLMRIGNYSLTIASFVLIAIFFISMVVYAVTNPRPLLQTYFSFFKPAKQEKAATALAHASTMLTGWFRANLIGGTIRAICVTVFLSIMSVPAAMVWGVLTFFSELVPKLGFYIMAIPTLLMALSVGPYTALWVLIFLIILDEIMGDVVLPKLRSKTMNIHPVSTFVILLVMAAAFGVMGVLLATPLTAIIKAYYEAFFLNYAENAKKTGVYVDAILYGEKEKSKPA